MTKKQSPNKFQYSITNHQTSTLFGYWNLVIGYCLVIVSWLLVITIVFTPAYAQDFTYASKGRRDPFVPLVGPGAVYQVKEAVDINSIEDVALEGIVYDAKGSASRVIINGVVLKEGDQIGIVVVDKIGPKKVTLYIEDNRYEVSLGKEEGGEGK